MLATSLLQKALIEAVSCDCDVILDPAMGSGSVMDACISLNRQFIGCDLE
jgi:DNA modification methylase